ncbi:MAG: SDR family oxidoreductase [Chloroflexi bacterium]|nr:SDR family oxidoreductase [Chloroflexota bacterium]
MADETKRPLALITGASVGIGEGFARHLAKRGYDLVLVARRKDRLDTLAAELSSEHSVSCDVLGADLVQEEGVSAVEERLRSGGIDLLVNNAGFGTVGAYVELPLDRELAQIDLNVRALVRLTHCALEVMVPLKRGAIINVASMAGFQAIPYNATYAATKAFVLHFSEAVHEEAKEHGITVTCLCPGPVRTEFQQVAGIEEAGVPAMAWTTVDTVVDSALSAMRSRRAIAIPGAFNAATAVGSRLMPRALTRRIAASFFKDRGRTGDA